MCIMHHVNQYLSDKSCDYHVTVYMIICMYIYIYIYVYIYIYTYIIYICMLCIN